MAESVLAEEQIVWRDLDGEVVILNLESGIYFGLEGSGNDIWRLLAQGCSRTQIVEQLSADYEVSPEQARTDLDRFLAELSAKGLVIAAPVTSDD
ncbi:MAG TPA: PqqD family protein [Candidatus Binataceae bacterium]|nr:PqqD family protein [Candidatus Binataceae bacterium]